MCIRDSGNIEALKAAVSNGADAVYLGMQKFGARAYSANFDLESLKEATAYAHLRNVKIYVTMNTIVFEDAVSYTHLIVRITGIVMLVSVAVCAYSTVRVSQIKKK